MEKKVKKAVGTAKHKYEVQVANNAKTNPKMFYSYLNKKKRNKVQIGPIKSEDGELCYQEQEMAEALNAHYSKIFTVEEEELPSSPALQECAMMEDVTFYEKTVKETLQHMKNSASPGPDEVSQRVLKELATTVSLPLCLLFNKSMQSGVVPTDWKSANVIPIFKKGSKVEPVNYRPVSLTSVVVKIMERILKQRMMVHLQQHILINTSQHGFMPRRSTTTNLVTYLDYVTKRLDDKEPVDVLYLDFAKAFDKVPHKRLIQKIKCLIKSLAYK